MFFITGDTHGSYSHIAKFVKRMELDEQDVVICLGDTQLNYFADERDLKMKERVARIPITLLCVHGNHDRRPETIESYQSKTFYGGTVYYEPDFPTILFAQDGEVFRFDGRDTIIIGGAYSIDWKYRLERGWNWFEDEQPSETIKRKVEKALEDRGCSIDVVVSHTCPLKYLPEEALFSSVDQSIVDKSTEEWLDSIEDCLSYHRWYCGHFHINKNIDRISFLHKDIVALYDGNADHSIFEEVDQRQG